MKNYEKNFILKINDYFRINFIGKPFELNKLINDNSAILDSKEEADKVIKACKKYKGWQYLGQLISVTLLLTFSSLSKRFNMTRSSQIKLVLTSFIPGAGLYYYSHFTYWDGIRDLVKTVREREKKYAHLSGNELEAYKIVYNTSKDNHKYILNNLGMLTSIKEILNI
jgi:hypothetical protein